MTQQPERPATSIDERPVAPTSGQQSSAFRFDWGLAGLRAVAPGAAVVIIVDVLRFTTAVSAAIDAGCSVIPARWQDDNAVALAAEHDAILAGRREDGGPSLSPTDLLMLDAGLRLVLPSPNGAALSMATRSLVGRPIVLAGCLRNAAATARRARIAARSGPIAVIASGERWGDDALRPAVEDLLGAGAILAALDPASAATPPCCSPEAAAARAAFVAARPLLGEALRASASGRQLASLGFDDDVHTSSALDVSHRAVELVDGVYVAA